MRTGVGATPPDQPWGGEAGDGGVILIPWARVPCGYERMRPEPREAIPGFLTRLRRHETAADLLIVRILPRPRMVLMRAALLGGGVVLPLDGSDEVRDEACRLSREVIENYVDLSLWPVTDDRRALERYRAALRDFPGARPCPLETSSGPSVLDGLPGAPEEGFLPALLRLEDASPPPGPLHEDLLRL